MLTQKQKDLLMFIHSRLSAGNIAPSFEEMKNHLGLKSKSGIHRLVSGLVERGYIERLPNRARAMEIKKLPPALMTSTTDNIFSESAVAASASSDPADSKDRGRVIEDTQWQSKNNLCEIPLCGKIAAGTPIEAIKQDGETIHVPDNILGQGEHYALIIEGDSMTEAGILDSDTVIIQSGDSCNNGDIVVALVDEKEATLKRLYSNAGTITLVPENSQYETQALTEDRVRVQGVLKALIRHY